jgi:hypothetical protein
MADSLRSRRILNLLYSPTFYTPYGIHTVSRDEAEYHPNFGHGLMGGLWPNLSAWVAYAGRRLYPDRVVEMMAAIFALSEIDNPADEGHLVPGEFPEWFDGETWKSRGMAMSPWMPPTYLWLGVEGLAGVTPTAGNMAVDPNLPANWDWLIMRDLPYCGQRISYFVHEGQLHTTCPVQSSLPQVIYSRDVTGEVEAADNLHVAALEGGDGTTLLLAAPEGAGGRGMVNFRGRTQAVDLHPGKATLIRWEH